MTEIDCRHCRWSQWSQWGLYCTHAARAGEVCPLHRHCCPYFQREPGADDDRVWP